MYKILVVEDDSVIANQLVKHLTSWGFEAKGINDFQNVLDEFLSFSPSIVLLDIQLPFFNGFHWCTEIRKKSKVPIIYLSSASDNMNIILAMNMGGDDFIAKPFNMNVLIAKIKAILRRTYEMNKDTTMLEVKGLVLNMDDQSIVYKNKKADLPKNEYRILKILMENEGRIVSREMLMQKIWDTDEFIDDNTLTVNVTRLRKTLSYLGLDDFILTRKGSGYQI